LKSASCVSPSIGRAPLRQLGASTTIKKADALHIEACATSAAPGAAVITDKKLLNP
jgi:hypothetical protein